MPVTVTELDHSTVFVFWSTLMPYLIINMACCEVFKKKTTKKKTLPQVYALILVSEILVFIFL